MKVLRKTLIILLIFFLAVAVYYIHISRNKFRGFARSDQTPSLIIFMFDGLTQEHVQTCSGPGRRASSLCEIASESVVFDNHLAQSLSFTRSFDSFLTSTARKAQDTKKEPTDIGPAADLVSLFSTKGYASAFLSNLKWLVESYNRPVIFDYTPTKKLSWKRAVDLSHWILYNHDKPIFLIDISNFLQDHRRYKVNEMPIGIIRYLHNRDITFGERRMKRMIGLLKALDKWDNSFIVITSARALKGDSTHNQRLKSTRRFSLYEKHVPCIIKFPKNITVTPAHIQQRTSAVDIMPTLLDFLGLAPISGSQGKSLRILIEDKSNVYD